MKKERFPFLLFFVLISMCLPFYAGADSGIDYQFINSKDTSYANIRRGIIRIRIKHDIIPPQSELKQTSKEAWKKYRGRWKIGTVFMYVKDMPANSTAYAASEFKLSRIQKFWINTQALDVHDYSKNKDVEAVKEGPNISAESGNHFDADGEKHLEIGKQYTLKKKTPLMPGPTPEKGVDGLVQSLKKAIYLNPSDTILITMKKNVGSVLWYGIMAYKSNGDSIGKGWINSIALIGQDL